MTSKNNTVVEDVTAGSTEETITHAAPPIHGYRDLSDDEVKLINEIKTMGMSINQMLEALATVQGIDMRWLAIAQTDLQKGMMAATRAIARPGGF